MTATAKVNVAVVDDHPLIRAGLRHVLSRAAGLDVVAEGETGNDAVNIARDGKASVIILDVGLPGNGITAMRAITDAGSGAKVMMLTVSDEASDVISALEAGARGYLLKGISAAELVHAVQQVDAGETYISPSLAARLLIGFQAKPKTRGPAQSSTVELTAREKQILHAAAKGMTNKEIARSLGLSEKTVKHYMTSVLQKLQVRNRVEAIMTLKRTPEIAAE